MCQLGYRGIVDLALGLRKSTSLLSLSVEWNEIGADGMKALAIALKKVEKLNKLKIGII